MSQRDVDLLRELRVDRATAHQALGVSRQALGQGLRAGRDYLTPDRLRTIYEYLRRTGAVQRANRLRNHMEAMADKPAVRDWLRLQVGVDDAPAQTAFRRLYVFSGRPSEIKGGEYTEAMKQKHFADENRTIAYLMPPGFRSKQMKDVLEAWWAAVPAVDKKENRVASVYLFNLPSVALVPHMVVIEPEEAGALPYALVRTERGALDHLGWEQVEMIMETLESLGIRDYINTRPGKKPPPLEPYMGLQATCIFPGPEDEE